MGYAAGLQRRAARQRWGPGLGSVFFCRFNTIIIIMTSITIVTIIIRIIITNTTIIVWVVETEFRI